MATEPFSGEPETKWLTQAPQTEDRCMILLERFWFRDPENKEWDAPKGMTTDGASIPRALWTLIGSPYTGNYRRAALVHDSACDLAGDDPTKRSAADLYRPQGNGGLRYKSGREKFSYSKVSDRCCQSWIRSIRKNQGASKVFRR